MIGGKPDISLGTLREKAPEAAEFMRQFGNANRLMLLCHIAAKERSVSDIQDGLGIKQPALSQQLAELRQSGLVKTRRASRQIYYSIADGRAKIVMDMLFSLFCAPDIAASVPTSASVISATVTPQPPCPVPVTNGLAMGEAAHFARLDPVERSLRN
jgi:DNA-binding transcriptional ArsR family regulator